MAFFIFVANAVVVPLGRYLESEVSVLNFFFLLGNLVAKDDFTVSFYKAI